MTDAITSATGVNWVLALCRKKKFSEYLLYGHFVANSLEHLATHRVTEDSIAVSHWEDTRLDRPAIEALMRAASPEQVALCIQSYSSTSIDDIRDVFRLNSRDRRGRACLPITSEARPNSKRPRPSRLLPQTSFVNLVRTSMKGFWLELAVERQGTVRLLVLAGEGAVDPAIAIRKAPGQDRTHRAAGRDRRQQVVDALGDDGVALSRIARQFLIVDVELGDENLETP